ncbi:MAG: hypothetical protein OK455_11060, partial [Thaumarchaeota archaeon]|nr:hypothetical protein [Nitrososphaerota archaeon]
MDGEIIVKGESLPLAIAALLLILPVMTGGSYALTAHQSRVIPNGPVALHPPSLSPSSPVACDSQVICDSKPYSGPAGVGLAAAISLNATGGPQPIPFDLGYGPSAMSPVPQGIPVYAVGDTMWAMSTYNQSVTITLLTADS